MKGLRAPISRYQRGEAQTPPSCGSMLCTIVSLTSSSFTKFYGKSVGRRHA